MFCSNDCFPAEMQVYVFEGVVAAADSGFITPRSAVRSRPPLPIKSIT